LDAPRGPFDEFAIATAVLTRLPVGAALPAADELGKDGAIAASGWAFPLVGAGIGALAALAFLVAELLGCGAAPAALLAVAAGLAVTGAFHEDGLADTADGFGGGTSREEKLAIMRDSRHGTFGILALVLSIGLRAAALGTIGEPIRAGLALIAAHAASRGALPPLMRLMAPARADGLGAAAGRPSRTVAIIAAGLGAALALALLGPRTGAVALALSGGALALAAMLARHQIGGYTGDVLGFFQQIGEIVMLLAAAAR
jgi:adenosylcobinamide-GDP ribazoletransferase